MESSAGESEYEELIEVDTIEEEGDKKDGNLKDHEKNENPEGGEINEIVENEIKREENNDEATKNREENENLEENDGNNRRRSPSFDYDEGFIQKRWAAQLAGLQVNEKIDGCEPSTSKKRPTDDLGPSENSDYETKKKKKENGDGNSSSRSSSRSSSSDSRSSNDTDDTYSDMDDYYRRDYSDVDDVGKPKNFEDVMKYGSKELDETFKKWVEMKPQKQGVLYYRAKYRNMKGEYYTPIWESFNGRLKRRDVLPNKSDHHYIYLPTNASIGIKEGEDGEEEGEQEEDRYRHIDVQPKSESSKAREKEREKDEKPRYDDRYHLRYEKLRPETEKDEKSDGKRPVPSKKSMTADEARIYLEKRYAEQAKYQKTLKELYKERDPYAEQREALDRVNILGIKPPRPEYRTKKEKVMKKPTSKKEPLPSKIPVKYLKKHERLVKKIDNRLIKYEKKLRARISDSQPDFIVEAKVSNYHNKLLARIGEKFVEYIERQEQKKLQLEEGEIDSESSGSSPEQPVKEVKKRKKRVRIKREDKEPKPKINVKIDNLGRYKNPDTYKKLPKHLRNTEMVVPDDDEYYLYCPMCRYSFRNSRRYVDHLFGYTHRMLEAKVKRLLKNQTVFQCEMCGTTCQGTTAWDCHVNGAAHKRVVAQMMKKNAGEDLPKITPKIIPLEEFNQQVPYETRKRIMGAVAKQFKAGGTLHVGPNGELFTEDDKPGEVDSAPNIGPQIGLATGPTNGPQIGPQIGPQLGPQIGPQIGPQATPTLANDGPKKATATEYTWAQQYNWEENEKNNKYRELEETYNQRSKGVMVPKVKKHEEPVGEEFIEMETDAVGKILQFWCHLCKCSILDANGKDLHLKGKRHHGSYRVWYARQQRIKNGTAPAEDTYHTVGLEYEQRVSKYCPLIEREKSSLLTIE